MELNLQSPGNDSHLHLSSYKNKCLLLFQMVKIGNKMVWNGGQTSKYKKLHINNKKETIINTNPILINFST